jgi:hypothetical protein
MTVDKNQKYYLHCMPLKLFNLLNKNTPLAGGSIVHRGEAKELVHSGV